MALADRAYMRSQPPPGGPGRGTFARVRMWSVSTWLIVICCVVFAVDTFSPQSWIDISFMTPNARVAEIPADVVVERPPAINQVRPQDRHFNLNVYDRHTNEVVGYVTIARMGVLTRYLHFSTARGFLSIQYWRFIGFQFLHYDLTHLFFNMLALFFFGQLVEQHLGRKRFLAFYLLCGICGALLYLVLNLGGFIVSQYSGASVPLLLFNDPLTPLVGASAGVFGVLIAAAYLAPREIVLVFFVLPMRLKYVAYGLVAIALYTLYVGGTNAGGEAGHLGGAIAGFYFIRHQHHLHGFFDVLGYADPTSHHYREKKAKASTASRASRQPRSARSDAEHNAEIDRILLKIKERGMGSLNEREQSLLRDESTRRGTR